VLGPGGRIIRNAVEGAIVEIVNVEVTVPEPGVTLAGEKEQDESEGNPEHVSETGFVNALNLDPMFMVYGAECPGEMVAIACALATVKSLTVI
jgi:hypothetical protein